MQGFVYDTTAPSISITPLATLTGSDLDFRVIVTDDQKVLATGVQITSLGSAMHIENLACTQVNPAKLQCNFTVSDPVIN